MMNSQKRLLISLGAGGIVFCLVYLYLESAERKINSHFKMTSVLRVKTFIRQGRTLSEDLLETVSIPEAFLAPKAVRAISELKDAAGRFMYKAGGGFLKGEQLTKNRIYKEREFQSLAWSVPVGQTAMTLRLNSEQGVGGHLEPGDWVNVYCVEGGSSFMLLTGIQALAVQERIWDPAKEMEEKNISKTMEKENILVTLGLMPRQAAILLLGMEKGKIWLTLNSPLGTGSHEKFRIGVHNLGKE